jgi:hypothetical protein
MEYGAEGDWTGRFILDHPPGDNLAFTSHHLLNIGLLFLDLLSDKCGWSIDKGRRSSIGQKFFAIRPDKYLTLERMK